MEEARLPLLEHSYSSSTVGSKYRDEDDEDQGLKRRVWVESRKLWYIVGPAILSRIFSYSMNVITQAFAGHLGDLDLAAISIVNNVITGFDFGLLLSVYNSNPSYYNYWLLSYSQLGMASALETLCGQAYGAKRYKMLGVYMQRSWIVLSFCCLLLLPLYIFATPVLKLLGQPKDVAELSGFVALWMIPLHFSFAFQFPLQRFLQSQLKTGVIAWISLVALVVHAAMSWLFVFGLKLGVVGTVVTLNISWWILVLGLFAYTVCGGCPLTWAGFSIEAFSGLWEFTKLSAASGVMLCLENWYYRILILMTGNLKDAKIAVDALSICMTINGWEMMIPLAFFAGTGVRVANELGAGNGKGAKFATIVSVTTSIVIGLFFWLLILIFHNELGIIFSSSKPVLEAVNQLSILLAFAILLNSVQPVLSGILLCLDSFLLTNQKKSSRLLIGYMLQFSTGVAVGMGWQSRVAYINLACYYLIGLPLGLVMELLFHQGVMGIWGGMIAGTALQTLVLGILTLQCNWEKEAEKASEHVKEWTR
ncbi:hypothetical protein RJ640_011332 [Escallonia rubra]|uniref:Protein DETOXIFICATION n=1 Tax=Escallonia rubra TaxID=112253 RepID=A0AA88QJN1_9ASTE|nr:hypothetical protein RJ640_011332 [Escallonia rubra]